MLDIKWKNNKIRSFLIALTAAAVVTTMFLVLLPIFQKSAKQEFENPLISEAFLRSLYEDNYVQYKYLREKAEQQSLSYGQLYVKERYLGDSDSLDLSDCVHVDVSGGATEGSKTLLREVEEYKESSLSSVFRTGSQGLTQYMDYCARDTKTGTVIGNSDREELLSLLMDETKADQDSAYVYSIRICYDGAGNTDGFLVRTNGDVDAQELLKKVEAQGRQTLFAYGSDSDYSRTHRVAFYNGDEDKAYVYELTAHGPENMQIVYALTKDQYEKLAERLDKQQAMLTGYLQAGVAATYQVFWVFCVLLGALLVWILNRVEKDSYVFGEMFLCRLPAEALFLLALVFYFQDYTVTRQICNYQNGWMLPGLSRNILDPLHLGYLRFFLLAGMLFCLFFTAFSLGSVLPNLRHPGAYLRKHSLILRYGDRIREAVRAFYQKLMTFDIGKDAKGMLRRLIIFHFILLSFFCMFWGFGIIPLFFYLVILYFLLKKYVRNVQEQYRALLRATGAIARGNFDTVLSEDFGMFESYKTELEQIQKDFKQALEREVRSQRMKSELITNVSHDLKTPLTAIITYIDLLKNPELTTEQRKEYLDILDRKSARLKALIEGLFEVSKGNSKNVTLHYDNVDMGNLLRQCYLEQEDRFLQEDLTVRFSLPEKKTVLRLDPQITFRIFENLYTNIIKYALPGTRVYISLKEEETEAVVELKNISRFELDVEPEELLERFVRGDSSRNTEGSGLGLAIAQSFTELQHGSLQILLDGDLFKVTLRFCRDEIRE